MVKVLKKDGRVQEFDKNKIKRALVVAGTLPDQADRLVMEIENWIKTQTAPMIASSEIRKKIIELLKRVNPQATKGFKSHRKSHFRG